MIDMKFKINNLGKIKEANIDLKNLTFFVGKNGTGKTYCASAIWSIINYVNNINIRNCNQIVKNLELTKFFKQIKQIDGGEFYFVVDKDKCFSLRKSVQDKINNDIGSILKDAMGLSDFGDSKIEVFNEEETIIELSLNIRKKPLVDESFLEKNSNTFLNYRGKGKENLYEVDYKIRLNNSIYRNIAINEISSSMLEIILRQEIFRDVIGYGFFGTVWNKFKRTVYLPAARTGIMLAVNYFVEGALQRSVLDAKDELQQITSLPLPLRDFATRIYNPHFYRINHKISHPLEKIFQGKLYRKPKGILAFKPNDCSIELPLSSSSSLVTELAGFYLIGEINDQFLIFEEPEAHLHLEAQRELAKYLAELINAGAKILITTHSDTFIQQINNLITLGDHPKKDELLAKLGISKNEVISRESVIAYEFFAPKGQGVVEEIKLSRTGFIVESLNEVLIKLTEETLAINGELEDDVE